MSSKKDPRIRLDVLHGAIGYHDDDSVDFGYKKTFSHLLGMKVAAGTTALTMRMKFKNTCILIVDKKSGDHCKFGEKWFGLIRVASQS